MRKLSTLLIGLTLAVGGLRADDKPGRAEQLKAIRADLAKAQEGFRKEMKAGTIKPDAEGEYPGWTDLLKRFVEPTRALIAADPADAVALDAILFAVRDLDAADPDLFGLALKHHVASEKIDPLLRLRSAPVEFLREVAVKSPHPRLRIWSEYHLAEALYAVGKREAAEPLLESLCRNAEAKALGGYATGTLADTAGRLLFEMRKLNVGQEAPELAGEDLDDKPLKLTDYRGKVTLFVFWATWCGPCMDMVAHERKLVEHYAARPFAIVGANGDTLPHKRYTSKGEDGKVIDNTVAVKAAVEKNKITWRSFRNVTMFESPRWTGTSARGRRFTCSTSAASFAASGRATPGRRNSTRPWRSWSRPRRPSRRPRPYRAPRTAGASRSRR